MFQSQPAPHHQHQFVPVTFGDHLGCTGCLAVAGNDRWSESAAASNLLNQASEWREDRVAAWGGDAPSLAMSAMTYGLVPHPEPCAICAKLRRKRVDDVEARRP